MRLRSRRKKRTDKDRSRRLRQLGAVAATLSLAGTLLGTEVVHPKAAKADVIECYYVGSATAGRPGGTCVDFTLLPPPVKALISDLNKMGYNDREALTLAGQLAQTAATDGEQAGAAMLADTGSAVSDAGQADPSFGDLTSQVTQILLDGSNGGSIATPANIAIFNQFMSAVVSWTGSFMDQMEADYEACGSECMDTPEYDDFFTAYVDFLNTDWDSYQITQ